MKIKVKVIKSYNNLRYNDIGYIIGYTAISNCVWAIVVVGKKIGEIELTKLEVLDDIETINLDTKTLI